MTRDVVVDCVGFEPDHNNLALIPVYLRVGGRYYFIERGLRSPRRMIFFCGSDRCQVQINVDIAIRSSHS